MLFERDGPELPLPYRDIQSIHVGSIIPEPSTRLSLASVNSFMETNRCQLTYESAFFVPYLGLCSVLGENKQRIKW